MKKTLQSLLIALLATVGLILPAFAQSPRISTDKKTYAPGEKIIVKFSGASGEYKDWIGISKAGTPDDQEGIYNYIPYGKTKGTLTFEAPTPGKYEARGYYTYSRDGYIVSARCKFQVVATPTKESLNPRLERKKDPYNELESKVPRQNGLVYIFNWYTPMIAELDVQIQANGDPITVLSNRRYFPYSVPAGNIYFLADTYFRQSTSSTKVKPFKAGKAGEATVKVKPGHVYYLSLRVTPTARWDLSLERVTCEEGDKLLKSGSLYIVK